MTLSVIIVNYNVEHFLKQCLRSVRKSLQNIDGEIIVVDNASVDGSIDMIKSNFPEVRLIQNQENVGFSTANNQGIYASAGKYTLILNPDTILEEDTLGICIDFMDITPDAGAIGVKMIDGSGKFLPESKRGFPSPAVAFYKATGLSKVFPKSKIFNRYHLGFLDENETHTVDVLTGAFFFTKKDILLDIGCLDEHFFMYGEDIDLSYRIKQKGYQNYYLPTTTIIHFKGESTKKGSLNYIKTFYNAMIIFAKKHLEGEKAKSYIFLIKVAIVGRGILSFVKKMLVRLSLIILDLLFIALSFHLVKVIWAMYYFDNPHYYGNDFYYYNLPLYAVVLVTSLFFGGAYDRKQRPVQVIQSLIVGSLILFAIYGLLPLTLRSSRAILSFGILGAAFFTVLNRHILSKVGYSIFNTKSAKRLLIVGNESTCKTAESIIAKSNNNLDIIGYVTTSADYDSTVFLNTEQKLDQLVKVYNIDEVIFCADDIPSSKIIHWMKKLGTSVNIKILPTGGFSIIGSHSKNTSGELYTVDVEYNLSKPDQRRIKRTFEISIALIILCFSPILFVFQMNKAGLFPNIFALFFGVRALVGYNLSINSNALPSLKKAILYPVYSTKLAEDELFQQNFLYAKNYNISTDLQILFTNLDKLGNR